MSDSDDQKPKQPGGVKHDSRGNAVWQWAAESGRHAIDSTSRLLKRLEVPGLKLEDDKPKSSPRLEGNDPAVPSQPMKGYDPYGRRTEAPRTGAAQATARPATKPATRPGARPQAGATRAPLRKPGESAPRRSWLSRLFRK
jgi:hypothetical protein